MKKFSKKSTDWLSALADSTDALNRTAKPLKDSGDRPIGPIKPAGKPYDRQYN